MNDISSFKGRDFLMCRTHLRAGNEIVEAARSIDLPDFQFNPQKIRFIMFALKKLFKFLKKFLIFN